jgi:NADPH:quinone reductase-like Zn-dependent oxidoreductase
MKAVAFTRPLPIDAEDSLVELELPQPEFGPWDLLVNVRAASVNPVDAKVRARGTRDRRRTAQANRGCLAGMECRSTPSVIAHPLNRMNRIGG